MGFRKIAPCSYLASFLVSSKNLLVFTLLTISPYGVLGEDKCPVTQEPGVVEKAYTKPCVGKFSYCLPGQGAVPWTCPRSLVYNSYWNECDSRKACKRPNEEGDTYCLNKPCGLYPGNQCNLYFICSGGVKVEKKCHGTNIFDYISRQCKDPSAGAKCKESLVRRPIVPTDVVPDEPYLIADPCTPHEFPGSEGKRAKTNDGTILNSPEVTNYGTWHNWSYCPEGQYFTGIQMWKRSTEGDDGAFDHSGIISVGYKCEDLLHKGKKSTTIGQCANGAPDAEWDSFLECQKGVGSGMQLSQLKDQGLKKDDVATDNLKMFCSCGRNNELTKPYHKKLKKYKRVGGQMGKWTAAMHCQQKQALCGFRSQLHDWVKELVIDLEEVDMTGLNAMKFKCCDVPNPGECTPKQTKLLLQTCDNTDAEVTRPCPFNTTVGLVYNTIKYERAAKFYESIGHTLKATAPTIKASIEAGIAACAGEEDAACEQQWRSDNELSTRIYKMGFKETNSVKVAPGDKVQLYQATVSCGIYKMYTNQITTSSEDMGADEISLF